MLPRLDLVVGGCSVGLRPISVDILLAADRPDRLEAELDLGRPPLGDLRPERRLVAGSRLLARLGGRTIFDGRIDAVGGSLDPWSGRRIRVVAWSAYHFLRARASDRVHVQATDSEVAETVAATLELPARVDPTTKVHPVLAQEGDPLAFLRRRSIACGFELAVAAGALWFRRRIPALAPPLRVAPRDGLLGATIARRVLGPRGRGGTIELLGRCDLAPLGAVRLEDADPEMDGTYRVLRCMHRVDLGGFRTTVDVAEEDLR